MTIADNLNNARIDFPVDEINIKTANEIKIATKKAIVRTDNNVILGVVGNSYKLIPHQQVIDHIEKALPDELMEKHITLCRSGAVMFAKYETRRIKQAEIKKGDIVRFGLEVFNSYDGSMPVGFRFVAMRLACLNGITIPQSIARLSVKHVGSANFSSIQRDFNKRLPLLMRTADKWQSWSRINPTEKKINNFLKKNTGARLRKIFSEDYQASRDKTVWELFNIITQYATHRIRVKNPENTRLAQLNFDRTITDNFYHYNWM